MSRSKETWENEVSRIKAMIEKWQKALEDIEIKIQNPIGVSSQEFSSLISERSHIIKMIHDLEVSAKERYNGDIKLTKENLYFGGTLSY